LKLSEVVGFKNILWSLCEKYSASIKNVIG